MKPAGGEISRAELTERAAQLRQWLETEVRLMAVDDVSESERERMEERAETARLLECLVSTPGADAGPPK